MKLDTLIEEELKRYEQVYGPRETAGCDGCPKCGEIYEKGKLTLTASITSAFRNGYKLGYAEANEASVNAN